MLTRLTQIILYVLNFDNLLYLDEDSDQKLHWQWENHVQDKYKEMLYSNLLNIIATKL